MIQFEAEMGQLLVGPSTKLGLHRITGNEDRPNATRLSASDISRLEAIELCESPDNRTMFAMGPNRNNDRWALDPHRPRLGL